MAYNSILEKTERAFASAVGTVATANSLAIRTGLETAEAKGDAIVIICRSAEPVADNVNKGNMLVAVDVAVSTSLDDNTEAQIRAKQQAVADVIYDDALANTLTAAISDFACLYVVRGGQEAEVVDRRHMAHYRLTCHCAPSDIG